MNLDSVNKWLTLSANVGVIVGIAFLSLELRQANRIAVQEARAELTSSFREIQKDFLESPDLVRALLQLETEELTPYERFQTSSYANLLVNQAASINLSYENGFISENVMRRYMSAQSAYIKRTPGIEPFLYEAMQALGLSRRGVSPVFDNLLDAVGASP